MGQGGGGMTTVGEGARANPILRCGDETCYHRNDDGSCRCTKVVLVHTSYPNINTGDKSFWCDMHIEKRWFGRGVSLIGKGKLDDIARKQEGGGKG